MLLNQNLKAKNFNLYAAIMNYPIVFLLIIGFCHVWLFWPGMLSPDSQGQYAMAIAGVYNDHHPPLMSFVWRYLDKIHSGPGMMFLLHMSLLYGSLIYLIRSLAELPYRFLFILFPLIPHILVYANMIWKDVGFAFSFLFVACYLSYLTAIKQKLSWYQTSILLIILFYGTAVKFQAQYCAPILLAWIAYSFSNYKLYAKKNILCLLIISIPFYVVINNINNIFIPNVTKAHAWQYVKLYDLAAISVQNNYSIFPEFAKNKNYTLEKLTTRFNHQRVDDLVFVDPILKKGETAAERQELYSTWLHAVYQHPLSYIKHRCLNMYNIILYPIGLNYISTLIEKRYSKTTLRYTILSWIAKITTHLVTSNFIVILLGLTYVIYGVFSLRKSWAAIPLICFNGVGLTMVGVLFFCAMAGTSRYTYICMCMLHASHAFAYLCLRASNIYIKSF